MRTRFLVVASPGRTIAEAVVAPTTIIANAAALEKAVHLPELLLYTSIGAIAFTDGTHRKGFACGPMFDRGARAALVELGQSDAAPILASRGETLMARYWGGYVVLLVDETGSQIDIIRAPMGELPCYWTERNGTLIATSDLELLLPLAGGRHVDWPALTRFLAAPELLRSETCLGQIREVRGGDRLSIGPTRTTITPLWSPWSFAAPERQIEDVSEAQRRVRDGVLGTIAPRASEHGQILLRLSGGLDSSIVAASLAHTGADFTCITLVSDGAGDERHYARSVCNHLGRELIEAVRSLTGVDLHRSAAAGLPRPSARAFAQESVRLATNVAKQAGADAVFSGGGGDNLFCSLQSVAPVADRLRVQGLGPAARTAVELSRLADSGLPRIAKRTLARALRRSPAFRWPLDFGFLSAGARQIARGADHDWLTPPAGALPGKAAHVALIAAAQSLAEGEAFSGGRPWLHPLLGQPAIETCLRVPSWLWLRGGRNRAVARAAFASDLPAMVIERRSKGAPDAFVARLFEANRAMIRDMVLGGWLMREGLLDRAALEPALCQEAVWGDGFARIMRLVDAEAWACSMQNSALP
jgi:asparagine synthase (glutamine-hydrolysing)